MIRKILVPLDGSQLAETALPFATALARRASASLALIRATDSHSLFGDVGSAQTRIIASAEKYLESVAGRLNAEGLQAECGAPFGGSPSEWIVDEIEMRQADLAIMATHARAGAEHWLHGSVAESVVHKSHVPVMVVPAGAAQRLNAEHPTVVVPLDGSLLSESVLPFASDFARAIAASMVLVAVVPRQGKLVAGPFGAVTIDVGDDHSNLEGSAGTYLADIAEWTKTGGVSAETVLRHGEAPDEIIATIEEYAPAVVVMATHGRAGLVRTMLGSVAGAVVHRAALPIVLVHPTAIRQAESVLRQPAPAK
jgi:nucleotide-binding universal stress UspA family protein